MQCDELKEHGASVGESPAAVVKKCKYTIGMLSDPPAALSVSPKRNSVEVESLSMQFKFMLKGISFFTSKFCRWFLAKMVFLNKFVREKAILTCQLSMQIRLQRFVRFGHFNITCEKTVQFIIFHGFFCSYLEFWKWDLCLSRLWPKETKEIGKNEQ